MHDLVLKEKREMCKSLWFKGKGVGTTCQFFLKRHVLLINFSVASIIVLLVTTVNSE